MASDIYTARFDETAERSKDAIWRELGGWLQQFIDEAAPVLDIACDRGYFIRNVVATERWASDVRDVESAIGYDIHFTQADGLDLLSVLPARHFGTVFMSNYLEHLRSRQDVIEQLRVVHELLRPRGRVIILQPNLRLVGARYWDFIDHHVAITDRSLGEAAGLAGFREERMIVRFLPYSTKGRLPRSPRLVRWYLGVPAIWRLLGRQTLYIGVRG